MKSKTVIAMALGLIFQLAQVVPGMAAIMADCRIGAESCECCAGLTSCPCAQESEPVRNPLPLPPDSGQTLKVPLAKASGTRVSPEAIHGPQTSVSSMIAIPVTSPSTGYTGIPLSVAFCSFVI
jgi:hypothetical protein